MFVPLHDKNPLAHVRFQYVTVALIVANIVTYLATTQPGILGDLGEIAYSYGVTPAVFFDLRQLPARLDILPGELTLVSYMFLHANWMHLLGNMLFLWVFGDNVEDATGHVRFLVFYLACGIIAGLLHSYMLPDSQTPLVGASGAVAGIIAAYLMLHPRVKVWVLIMWRFPLRISALWALGFWAVMQVFNLAVADDNDQIAWWAHIGGLIAGAGLIVILRRSEVALFDRDLDEELPRSKAA